MKEIIIVLAFTVFVRLALSGTYQTKGPYDAVYKRIENCGTEDNPINFKIRVRKVSCTGIEAEGKITIKNLTINDDIQLKSVVQLFTPSGWKDNFYIFDYGYKGICSLQEELVDPIDTERTLSGGEYTLKGIDYTIKMPKIIPKTFFYGQYRVICHLYQLDRDNEVGCVMMYVDLVQKKNG